MHGVLVGYSERNLFYTFYAICKLDTWGFLRNLLRCSSKRSYLSISYLLVCSSPLLFKPVKFVLLLRRSNLPCSTDIVLAGCISEDQTHENLMVRGADSGMSAATLSIYILLWPQKSAHWCVCVCVCVCFAGRCRWWRHFWYIACETKSKKARHSSVLI